MITQERLKDLLNYNPNTGIFVWRVTAGKRGAKGNIAGYVTSHGYISISVDNKEYRAHRLAWLYVYGVWPVEIDHDDRNKSNNSINNLVNGTRQDNMKNMPMRSDNTSGITGVCWDKGRGKWRTEIAVNGNSINLGRFDDKFEAICTRKSAENKYGFHNNHGR